jgi:hypothetical protein
LFNLIRARHLRLLFWRWLAATGREPDEIGKLKLGCLIMGAFTALDGFFWRTD